jgi:hypothetical protein
MSIPVWGNLVSFESTSLWKQALAARSGDEHEKFRERLRVAYHTMRENVSPLVSAAHIDCPGLTVHDVTHLDALWETASLIGGDNFALNPAEAFVLGYCTMREWLSRHMKGESRKSVKRLFG